MRADPDCRKRNRSKVVVLAAVIAAVVLGHGPARAGIEGLSYTLQPAYDAIRWEKTLGLKDTELAGGRLALNFGRYVALQPYYFVRQNARTDLGATGVWDGLRDQKIDIRNYGADVVLGLGGANVEPFLRAGSGVIEFDPEFGNQRIRQVALKGGGGLRFGLSRFQGEVFVEDLAFRIDRYQFIPHRADDPIVTAGDPHPNKIRHSLSFGAGLNLKLGGSSEAGMSETDRAVSDRLHHGLSGLSIPIEPFIGRLDFHDDLGLARQNLGGVRLGLDFGPYVGVRGYYWRGLDDNLSGTMPIQSYGAEARFNLDAGTGLIPYLVLGGGQLDFMRDFHDESGGPRGDRSMMILGGGVSLPVGDRLRLEAGVRDHLVSTQMEATYGPKDELKSSWLFSGGLTFNLFGHGAPAREEAARVPPPVEGGPAVGAPAGAQGVQPGAPVGAQGVQPGAPEGAPGAPAGAPAAVQVAQPGAPAGAQGAAGHYVSNRMITIPVPGEGEIYIRYGHPGAAEVGAAPTPPPPAGEASADVIRAAVREELAKTAPGGYAGLSSDQQMELLERRLMQRIDERLAGLGATESAIVTLPPPAGARAPALEAEPVGAEPLPPATPPAPPPATPAATPPPAGGAASPGEMPYSVEIRQPGNVGLRGGRVYVGANVSDPSQAVFGGRLNLGGFRPGSMLHFAPELAFGSGGDADTWMVIANLQVDPKRVGAGSKFGFYAYAGTGLLQTNGEGGADSRTNFVINLGGGLEYKVGGMPLFVEYEGVKFFDQSRLLLGLRVK